MSQDGVSLKLILFALAAFAAASSSANAQTAPEKSGQADTALNLVLAVDTSGSVSAGRFELQKQGYAAAFRNPRVLASIRSLDTQSIAVTMMQWTGPRLHVVVVDWTQIKDEASAEAFAAAIEAAPRQLFGGGTSISGAIDYSRLLLVQSPVQGRAPRYRYFRRWFQQQRAFGDGSPGRSGARRRRHQWFADPFNRADA